MNFAIITPRHVARDGTTTKGTPRVALSVPIPRRVASFLRRRARIA